MDGPLSASYKCSRKHEVHPWRYILVLGTWYWRLRKIDFSLLYLRYWPTGQAHQEAAFVVTHFHVAKFCNIKNPKFEILFISDYANCNCGPNWIARAEMVLVDNNNKLSTEQRHAFEAFDVKNLSNFAKAIQLKEFIIIPKMHVRNIVRKLWPEFR